MSLDRKQRTKSIRQTYSKQLPLKKEQQLATTPSLATVPLPTAYQHTQHMCQKTMQMNKIIAFFKQHPIITTLLEIAIVAVILCTGVIFWLDSYTRHGTATIVPSVRYLSVTEASDILSRKGFRCEVIDSLFNDRVTPGVVVEQTPDAESRVKEGRTIYLTINAYSPKKVTMPTLIDGSARQAQAILRALGFTNILVEYEPSPYKDLVLDVLCNGRQVESGEKIPLTSRITLIVGMGDMPTDSLSSRSASTDSLIIDQSWIE